jgi:hypothetical protein
MWCIILVLRRTEETQGNAHDSFCDRKKFNTAPPEWKSEAIPLGVHLLCKFHYRLVPCCWDLQYSSVLTYDSKAKYRGTKLRLLSDVNARFAVSY